MNSPPAQKVNGLIDGIAVLQELAMADGPVSNKEIAEKLGVNKVRANRLLKTLAYVGLASIDGARKYSIGPGVHVLAAQSMKASGLFQQALPVLKRLTETGKTVALGVLWKGLVCYIYHNGRGGTEFLAGVDSKVFPAQNSSIGAVLLSRIDEADWPIQVDRRSSFYKSAKKAKVTGIAELFFKDHISMAVPTGSAGIAAVAISGVTPDEDIKSYRKMLRIAASEIK
ncbi:MAG: helix-turn-helix domain-containing protein [Lentisphaerae bacterium]|nr:helix-turn-helix domain-containing protein [Lentisphaerota bacterium]MCP4101462.1 helix-turn-helix domain-containing protein [Lentisphaerota bacterium]